mmetsp:Transcript_63215/g.137468  ORF Transcript_63215/g.137468 Transcript_63215/m.137468 type:complete len:203 (+) Transcript_63215:493-1101(+)
MAGPPDTTEREHTSSTAPRCFWCRLAAPQRGADHPQPRLKRSYDVSGDACSTRHGTHPSHHTANPRLSACRSRSRTSPFAQRFLGRRLAHCRPHPAANPHAVDNSHAAQRCLVGGTQQGLGLGVSATKLGSCEADSPVDADAEGRGERTTAGRSALHRNIESLLPRSVNQSTRAHLPVFLLALSPTRIHSTRWGTGAQPKCK